MRPWIAPLLFFLYFKKISRYDASKGLGVSPAAAALRTPKKKQGPELTEDAPRPLHATKKEKPENEREKSKVSRSAGVTCQAFVPC